MKNYACIFLVFLVTCSPVIGESTLNLIGTIGNSSEDEYMFFRIGGACFSNDEKHLYVTDLQRHQVSRYTVNGRFAGRFGRMGQGPHDFLIPIGVRQHGDELYVYDKKNSKIAVFNQELQPTRVLRLPGVDKSVVFEDGFQVIDENKYLFNGLQITDSADAQCGRLFLLDQSRLHAVFSRGHFLKKENLSEEDEFFAQALYGQVCFGYDRKCSEILVTHRYAANPALVYVLDDRGRQKKSFSLAVENKYVFPEAFRKGTVDEKPGERHMIVSDIFCFEDRYLFFYLFVDVFRGGAKKGEYRLLITDRQGKAERDIKLEGQYRFFAVSSTGLLLAKNHDDDEEKLYIFQLTGRG